MNKDGLVFNGIDGRNGTYLLPPFDISQLARMALGQRLPPAEIDELRIKLGQDIDYPLKEGADADDLAQSGWGIVFPFARKGSEAARRQAAIREALQPLLAHRRALATRRDERCYRECIGPDAYRPGETKQQFLARMGAGKAGPVDPLNFPYYLLLVASPEEISYRVQYQLDVQYAVGRIHFDTVDEYARYAEGVVEAETRPRPVARTAAFFGVENPDDRATYASARYLVAPLADYVERDQAERGWRVHRALSGEATKARLASLLGDEAPALLFTASHGMGFPSGDPLQRAHQGALLCQDWEGPRAGAVTPEHYFSGDDVAEGSDLRGLIAFHFACFGAGTPKHDDFVRQALGQVDPVGIAPQPFLARLPQRMLGRPRGALAYVGHVDRAWGSSFLQADPRHSGGSSVQLAVFESMLKRLLENHRVGHAMDFFNMRYAEMASDLATRIEGIQRFDEECSEDELARMWIYSNDARNYTVIGDPAVRIGGEAEPAHAETSRHRDEGLRRSLDGSSEYRPEQSWHAEGRRGPGAAGPGAPAASEAGPEGEPEGEPDLDYRWFGRGKDGEPPGLLTQLGRDMIQTLRQLVSDALSLEVQTFAGDHDSARAAASGAPERPRPSAYTHCAIDGDMVLCVPIGKDGAIDENLWRIHESAVAQAQKYRSDMLKLVLSLLPGVMP
jgi:hypothetical protein